MYVEENETICKYLNDVQPWIRFGGIDEWPQWKAAYFFGIFITCL